jgi:ATP adenylyltransferase
MRGLRAVELGIGRCTPAAGCVLFGEPILAGMDRLWTPWRYAYVTGEDRGRPKRGVPAALAAWPGDTGCVFCNMIAAVDYAIEHGMDREEAERAAYILERGRSCFLVLNAFPYNGGHLMVVPYRHEATLAGLPGGEAEEMMRQAQRSERVLRTVYKPQGLNFGINVGEAAGAGVADHLHLHAVPRWAGDTNFMSVLAETRILPEMLDESWRRLRAALAEDAAGAS